MTTTNIESPKCHFTCFMATMRSNTLSTHFTAATSKLGIIVIIIIVFYNLSFNLFNFDSSLGLIKSFQTNINTFKNVFLSFPIFSIFGQLFAFSTK